MFFLAVGLETVWVQSIHPKKRWFNDINTFVKPGSNFIMAEILHAVFQLEWIIPYVF